MKEVVYTKQALLQFEESVKELVYNSTTAGIDSVKKR